MWAVGSYCLPFPSEIFVVVVAVKMKEISFLFLWNELEVIHDLFCAFLVGIDRNFFDDEVMNDLVMPYLFWVVIDLYDDVCQEIDPNLFFYVLEIAAFLFHFCRNLYVVAIEQVTFCFFLVEIDPNLSFVAEETDRVFFCLFLVGIDVVIFSLCVVETDRNLFLLYEVLNGRAFFPLYVVETDRHLFVPFDVVNGREFFYLFLEEIGRSD